MREAAGVNAWHSGARWRGVGDCAKFRTFAAMIAHVLKTRDKLPAFFTGSTHGASAVMRVQMDPSPRLRMMLKTRPIPDSTIDARTAKIPRKRIPRPK